jgi:hypothetical protein
MKDISERSNTCRRSMVHRLHSSALHLAACATVLLFGCALPLEGEEKGDEAIAETSEALNLLPDFQIGLIGIKYDSAGHANKTTQAWTAPFNLVPGTDGGVYWSDFFTGQTNLTGLRMGLRRQAGGTATTQVSDFRIGIQGKNSRNPNAGTAEYTNWASEGGGWSVHSKMPDGSAMDQWAVGIQVRPWPASNTGRLTDIDVGVGVCPWQGVAPDDPCIDGVGVTPWLGSLQTFDTVWSHTSTSSLVEDPPPPPTGASILLNALVQH